MEIILVKFNQPKYEDACIESVKKFTDLNKHTLTIYDNYPKKENLAVVWNRLIEESEDENICLLNSDTLVEPRWERLIEALEDKTVGAVGPITNKCGGKQKGMERADSIEEINDLSGFCYCFRKSVWKEVGGFPEDMPFYGQESIFNRKLEDRGYKLKVDRRVFIHHHKGKSWLKAKEAGEVTIAEQECARMHYYNFCNRLKSLREKIPAKAKFVILATGEGNPFPSFEGIDQFVSDFGGVHLPMDAPIEDIMSYKPEYLIVSQSTYRKEWYDKVKEAHDSGVKTGLYFMDLRSPTVEKWQWNCFDLSMFDKAFVCSKKYVKDWKDFYKIDVEWLPQATLQLPIPPKGIPNKVVHIGGIDNKFHSNRTEFMKFIPEITQINSKNRDERAVIVSKQWDYYRGADFSLAVSPDVEGYTSDRQYHIMGSGGCALAFDPGGLEHLKEYGLWFKTKEELIELLNTPKAVRDNIKEKAFKYAQTNHLYKDRLIYMLKSLWDA